MCFDKRFIESANKALETGEKTFTTTLLVSPLKSQEQLKRAGADFEAKYGVKFIAPDYRSGGGTQDQSRVTKEQQLYRQDYCGCIYGLSMQREHQERLMDEMFSEISGRTLPASIEERLELYRKRRELEEQNTPYKIIKEKFVNYRQFSCTVHAKEKNIPAYALAYSTLPRGQAQGVIEFEVRGVHYFNREEIKFVSLAFFNAACHRNYATIKELFFNPPSFEEELRVRQSLACEAYNLSPIIVLDEIPSGKLSVVLQAKTYEDTREKLMII